VKSESSSKLYNVIITEGRDEECAKREGCEIEPCMCVRSTIQMSHVLTMSYLYGYSVHVGERVYS